MYKAQIASKNSVIIIARVRLQLISITVNVASALPSRQLNYAFANKSSDVFLNKLSYYD